MNKISLALLILIISKTLSAQNIQTEGLMNFTSPVQPKGWKCYTWFKDSTVIFEVNEMYSKSRNDSIISEQIRVYKYSILDLTNMRAQDYRNFTDTAKPVTNYLLKEGESISWDFYRENQPYDKFIDSLKALPDSIIEGNHYKRLYFEVGGNGWLQRITYYLSSSKSENIFHMSKKVDRQIPGYKIDRVEYTDMLKGISSFSQIILIKNKLTTQEHAIFKQWQNNLRTSTLPITSSGEASKNLAQQLSEP